MLIKSHTNEWILTLTAVVTVKFCLISSTSSNAKLSVSIYVRVEID